MQLSDTCYNCKHARLLSTYHNDELNVRVQTMTAAIARMINFEPLIELGCMHDNRFITDITKPPQRLSTNKQLRFTSIACRYFEPHENAHVIPAALRTINDSARG